ncbi:MAG: glycosyltransferase family 4 protein [Desulfobacterales bacterium]|nr:glycosyltransferase family 4 protein [Desulfobacterales bacterium]
MEAVNSKYNVLVVTDILDRSELALLIGLFKSRINIEVICTPTYDRQGELKDAGMTVHPYNIRHRLDIKAIAYIRRKLDTKNYRIVYALRNSSLAVSLFASMGKAVKIVGYRGTTGHMRGLLNPESYITYQNPGVDQIICVSNAVKNYLASRHIPASKLTTIYKGHEIAWYPAGGPKAPPAESGLPIPKEAFVVGFVGNIRPVKGVDVLIRAIQYIPASKNIYFVIIGDIRDPKIKKMRTNPAVTHRAYFAGFKKNAAMLMKYFDVFVMPSVAREGLPQALLEAMAQKIPSIASNVGGIPEIVIDRENGLIVPPGDPEKLAQAILFLFGHAEVRQKLGENAEKRIKADFNINDTIRQTMGLFDQLASMPPGRKPGPA